MMKTKTGNFLFLPLMVAITAGALFISFGSRPKNNAPLPTTVEDCQWLREQYNARNPWIEDLLTTDPASTPQGQACVNLNEPI
jgi:hypothetical protein